MESWELFITGISENFFSNKIQFVVSGACVAFVACMFLFDLTGYDNYIPSYDKIENIAAEFMDGGGWENTYSVEINEDGKISTQDSGYYRNGDLLGNNLGISPDIYACVEQIVKENKVYADHFQKIVTTERCGTAIYGILLMIHQDFRCVMT